MVRMIIKGILRRYERWNPVHPTIGAFWGMGIGFGCGIGWGPGFGPEVIGYVGAGCGIGFSVGFTAAGIGVGLPANYLFKVPYSVFMAIRSRALEYGQSNNLLSGKNVFGDGWGKIAPDISVFHGEATRKLSKFKQKHFLEKRANLFDMKAIPQQTGLVLKNVETFADRIFRPHKGTND